MRCAVVGRGPIHGNLYEWHLTEVGQIAIHEMWADSDPFDMDACGKELEIDTAER